MRRLFSCFANWLGDCRLSRHPATDPAMEHLVVDAGPPCQFSNGYFITLPRHFNSLPSVLHVLKFCYPVTVFRAVVSVIFLAINLMPAAWSQAHVGDKVRNVVPSLTNFNATATIIQPAFVLLAVTPRHHGCPYAVFNSLGLAVRCLARHVEFMPKASTTSSGSPEITCFNHLCFSAGTSTQPLSATMRNTRKPNYCQSTELATTKVNEFVLPILFSYFLLKTSAASCFATSEQVGCGNSASATLARAEPPGLSSITSAFVGPHCKAIKYLASKISEVMASSCYNFFRHIKLLFSLTVLGDGRLAPAVPVFVSLFGSSRKE